jgi:uncharacterized membrane protein YhaH (DUF805 family)
MGSDRTRYEAMKTEPSKAARVASQVWLIVSLVTSVGVLIVMLVGSFIAARGFGDAFILIVWACFLVPAIVFNLMLLARKLAQLMETLRP